MSMNNQAVFDRVARHLKAQGQPAQLPDGNACYLRYETSTGEVLKCAVGALIPDAEYDPVLEEESGCGTMLEHIREEHVSVERGLTHGKYPAQDFFFLIHEEVGAEDEEDWQFLASLQDVHDDAYPHEWPSALAHVADDWNLSDSVLADWDAGGES